MDSFMIDVTKYVWSNGLFTITPLDYRDGYLRMEKSSLFKDRYIEKVSFLEIMNTLIKGQYYIVRKVGDNV